jgi:hypothetical protein
MTLPFNFRSKIQTIWFPDRKYNGCWIPVHYVIWNLE